MSPASLRLVRAASAVAAIVLAVASRGDALVLAGLLALSAWRPLAALALVAALGGQSWRWASTSLEAWAGGQAVLGPAGALDPASLATSAWLAGAVVVLAVARRRSRPGVALGFGGSHRPLRAPNLAAAVASGTAAAAVVAGPAPGGELWLRAVAAVVATVAALVVAAVRARHRGADPLLDALAAVAAAASVVLVAVDAPTWSGTFDRTAAGYGAVLALAVGGIVVVGGKARAVLTGRPA